MKIEQLLVQHFYQKREVTLQGMGSFRLSPDVLIPAENDKDIIMPANAISFTYNPKATEDNALISFIVQQTRKIKPLASADLDSYVVLGNQFLNIGKPFKIEGLGILEKNQQGEYEFKQGMFTSVNMDAGPTILREKEEEDDISFAATRHKAPVAKKRLLIAVVILLVVMAGLAAWYFFFYKQKNTGVSQPATEQPVSSPVVNQPEPVIKDSSRTDSLQNPATVNKEYNFRVVFRTSMTKTTALSLLQTMTLRRHHVIMLTSDSVYYKMAEPFKLPLSDTTRIKDSLNRYYYMGKGFIELY